MRAVVYPKPGEFSIETIHDPHLGSGDVRIRVEIVGVCGTDQHVHVGEFGARFPLTPGHEIVGRVAEIGAGVTHLDIGDRVAIDPTIYCMTCEPCRRGEFKFCEANLALGVQRPGGFAETVVAEASKCYPVGALGLDAAVLVEPTACVVGGLDVLALSPGSDVLIVGAGPTSQIMSQLIVHGGASRVTMAAPTQFKLDVAEANGVDHTVLVDRADFASTADALRDLAPRGFDAVVEATGSSAVLQNLIPHVKSGGTVLVYGMAGEDQTITLSPYEIFRRELAIKGAFAHVRGFSRAIDFLQSGKVRPDGIVTHRFGLDDYAQALDALRASDCLKAVLTPNG